MVCFRKRQSSPEIVVRRTTGRPEASSNGKSNGSPQMDLVDNDDAQSLKSNDYEETDLEHQDETLDRRYHLFCLVGDLQSSNSIIN